ncbi:hypothetical protein ACFLUS_01595 [Chloroflexota bacterium]
MNKYVPGTSYLVDYCIEHYGAVVIDDAENESKKRPPFPCLTGASNTSNSYKIDQDLYPNIVAVGVDTLELNFGVNEYRHLDMFKQLDDAKLEAASVGYKGHKGIAFDWFVQEYMVQARGSKGGYEYLLRNGDTELQIMPDARGGKPSPELRVVFRSSYLWRVGEIPAYNKVVEFLNQWTFLEYCKVSRADLCVDRIMPLPKINRKTQVVSLLREKDKFYGGDFQSGQRETGFQFGRGGIACRFYDKAYEVSVKGQGHIMPLWTANGWDGENPVSRLELQLRRNGLRRFDPTMDFATFQDSKADIWAYGTEKFLRIVVPESTTRKERAQVTKYWRDYQSCVRLFGERQGVIPYKQLSLDWQPLVPQAIGCMASAWARLAADVGDVNAKTILEKVWGQEIPQAIVEAGLLQKARFASLS